VDSKGGKDDCAPGLRDGRMCDGRGDEEGWRGSVCYESENRGWMGIEDRQAALSIVHGGFGAKSSKHEHTSRGNYVLGARLPS
jgi:hypothetical protein